MKASLSKKEGEPLDDDEKQLAGVCKYHFSLTLLNHFDIDRVSFLQRPHLFKVSKTFHRNRDAGHR